MNDQVLAGVVGGYVEFAVSRGLPRGEALAAAGLSPTQLEDPDTLVPALSLISLWAFLVQRLPDEVVPLASAEWIVARLGILGRMLRTCADLRHGLTLCDRYRRLNDENVSWTTRARDGRLALELRHLPEVHALGLPIETMMAMSFRMLSQAYGGPPPLVEVTFSHRPLYPTQPYQRFFGAPVRFEADVDALWLRPETLDLPNRAADAELLRYLEAQAQKMVADLPPPRDPFIHRLREVIARELGSGATEEVHVARRLAVSTRTLQRRLAELETSFQDVLDDVRRVAAQRHLREVGATVLDAAFATGYADTSSFCRAFKRWTGETPQQWRRRASPP